MTENEKRARLNELSRKITDQGTTSLSKAERDEFFRLDASVTMERNDKPDDFRGVTGTTTRKPAAGEVRGDPNEPIKAGQAAEWYRKARENGVTDARGRKLSAEGSDRDLNRWAGELFGFAPRSVESRALGEDTGGSGQAITPQAWSANFIDVLLPNTVLGRVGASFVPMQQETVTVPVLTSTVSPAWVAEGGSISLDANPAFAPLVLSAQGGFKDITQYSIELAQDAYVQGSLPGMLAAAVARKMQVVLDVAALLGVAGNTRIPGLNAEAGFVKRHYTGDAAGLRHSGVMSV
jgi:HK97 family phage major capsid protein